MKFVQLVYRSEKTPFLNAAAFESESANYGSRNEALGITGLLISQKATFIGVLEGPEGTLFGLMERIIRDRRHRHVDVLYEDHAEQPRFANWHYGSILKVRLNGGGSALGKILAVELRASHRLAIAPCDEFPGEALVR